MHDWAEQLERCFEIGVADPSLESHIDEILSWYGRLNNDKDDLAVRLVEKYGEHDLRIRFEEFVDRLLVEKDIGNHKIFPLGLNSDGAKTRYRKLIRLFHPDRGAKDEAWLNYRAEKINIAYKAYGSYEEVLAETSMPDISVSNVKSSQAAKPKRDYKFRYRTNVWRERLGDPALLQKKMVYGLTVFSLLLVGFFYASTREVQKSSSDIVKADSEVRELVDNSLLKSLPTDVLSGLSEKSRQVLDEAAWLETDLSEEVLINQESEEFTSRDIEAVTRLDQAPTDMNVNGQENLVDSIVLTETKDETLFDRTLSEPDDGGKAQLAFASKQLVVKSTKSAELPLDSYEETSSPLTESSKGSSQAEVVSFPLATLKKEQKSGAICVEPSDAITVNRPIEGKVSASNLRLRAGPGTDCVVQIALLLGRAVTLLKYSSDRQWLYVSVLRKSRPELLGWVSSQFIASVNGVDIQEQLQLDQSVGGVFRAFKAAYEAGDAIELSNLYLSTARENKLRGKEMVLDSYQDFFRGNEQRSLEIEISSVQQHDDSTAIVDGVMNVGILSQAGGQWRSVTATFNMMIIKATDAYKIASFDWEQ